MGCWTWWLHWRRAGVGVLVVMFTVSSAYHSIPLSPRRKERMRRLDHAAIFLVVAGSATPIILLAVDGPRREATIGLLLAGGLVHAVGIVLFVMRRPVLAPGVFSFRELFHVLVMTGTAIHFHVIVNHIVPLAT